jgi:CHAT domain-containing protein/tetratricopeptide (TPR) repeat protein
MADEGAPGAAAHTALGEVISIRQRQPDRKDWRIADAKRGLAELDRRAAMTRKQRQLLMRAQDLAAVYSPFMAPSRYKDAEAAVTESLKIRGELTGEDQADYAADLYRLAAICNLMGDHARAELLLIRILEIRKKVLGEDHPDYAFTLDELGEVCFELGNYARAAPLHRRALEIWKSAVGEDHPNYAQSLHYLGTLYVQTGDYARAEPLLRRALQIYEKALGEEHPHYARSLASLGILYRSIGDNARAKPFYLRAAEIAKKALGEEHPDYAADLNNLGCLYRDMGDNARAEALYRRSVVIWGKALGEDNPHYAVGLRSLAGLDVLKGEYARAEPLYRRAAEITKRALGDEHPDYAKCLANLAGVYSALGDHGRGVLLAHQALGIYKRALGESHPDYADTLNQLAKMLYAQGQLAEAERSLSQGLTILTRWTQEGLTAFGERQRFDLVETHVYDLHLYLSVAPAAGMKAEVLYGRVLAWKGVIDHRQDEDRLARDQPELKETLSQLEQARTRLARLAFTVPADGQRQAWLEQLDALRDRKENLETDLARRSAGFRQVHYTRRLGAAEVAAALPQGSVLVDLFDYFHFSPPEGGKGPLRWEARLVAFVLRRGQAPVLVPLGASGPIDDLVIAWRQALLEGKPESMRAAALELSRRVWGPLKPHLEGVTTVVVAPDGALLYFPLAALPGRRPGTYLLEDLAIGYVTSAQRLVETLAAPNEAKPKSPEADAAGLLAIGGIDYQADPGSAAPTESAPTPSVLLAESQRAGFRALAGTEPEVRRVAQLFDAAFPSQRAVVLTGAAPTEAAVKQQLGRRMRYLHMATHGFRESPARVAAMRSGLKSDGFRPAGVGSSEESASLALSPLLHSGVALAGAARRTEDAGPGAQGGLSDRDDGILSAEEVQSLDLRGTELVVLSACETGLGLFRIGHGVVMGLQRAFHSAGARAVVASLWKVDDAATSVLMEQFYTNLWTRKMPKLEALRQAQLAVLNDPGLVTKRRARLAKERGIGETPVKLQEGGHVAEPTPAGARSDPSLWAAFVLSGDGR